MVPPAYDSRQWTPEVCGVRQGFSHLNAEAKDGHGHPALTLATLVLGRDLSLNLELLQRCKPSRPVHRSPPRPGVAGIQLLMWALRIQTPVLVPTQHVLLPLSHLPRPKPGVSTTALQFLLQSTDGKSTF